ncbi:MAG: ABC transporter ATP-binding protein [Proteobacteria bacterium]|nr:MAG: ABC transporter ATP-binding protein [Pseudomonadota bacterium]
MSGFASSLSTIWRLAAPYFRSEDRWAGLALLATLIGCELSMVGIIVLLNRWFARFYNSLQERNWETFIHELGFYCLLAAAATVLQVYQLYLNQWLQIRWRRWMTKEYLSYWLDKATHYRMQLFGDAADNPDQRIADDIRMFIERTLTIGVGLLGAVVTLASFVLILWGLSAAAPATMFGLAIAVPGYLVWAALIYAVCGTFFTHLIGRRLVDLNFNQQRFEADFRFNLVRVRENSEQIALLSGEKAETDRLLTRFGRVVANWHRIMTRQKHLTFFTTGFTRAAVVFPYVVVSPAYFAGLMQLGALVQTANAFNQVETAMSFFITVYRDLAEWRAVIARLDGFNRSIGTARDAATTPPRESDEIVPANAGLTIERLSVRLPTGAPLVTTDELFIKAGERALITGPSGSGKSTLFRAIAGVWPFGAGNIVVPRGSKIMILPQRPYFPIGSLEGAVSYPSDQGTFDIARVVQVVHSVGLPALAQRMSEEAHWNRILSGGEQQRLAIARAILQEPDYLFLDEATAALDEPSEAKLYQLLHERLPRATIVSIGHRSTLHAFHTRHLALHPEGGQHRMQPAKRPVDEKVAGS